MESEDQENYLTILEAWISLVTTIMRTIEYPLVETTITEDRFKWIMSPILEAGLPAAGICRKINQDFVYGPKLYQGLGLNKPHVTKDISHIKIMFTHMNYKTITGQLLTTSYEYLQLETGLSNPLKHQYRDLGAYNSTKTCLSDLWSFCESNGLLLTSEHPISFLQSEGDKELMPLLFKTGYRKTELSILNRCRKYLQILTISEVVHGDSKTISR